MEQNQITRLKADDVTALEEIIQDCSNYVCTILRNFSRGSFSTEDLEELTADVFVRFWNNRASLRDDMPISPYLATIARNCAKNRFRAMHRHVHMQQSLDDFILPDETDLLRQAEQADLNAALLDSLEHLPKTERELMIRFYFYGEKTSEIAIALGLSDTAVRLRLHISAKIEKNKGVIV